MGQIVGQIKKPQTDGKRKKYLLDDHLKSVSVLVGSKADHFCGWLVYLLSGCFFPTAHLSSPSTLFLSDLLSVETYRLGVDQSAKHQPWQMHQ